MKPISKSTRIAVAAAMAMAVIEACAAPVDLGALDDRSAPFDNSVVGAFTDTWAFDLSAPSLVAASLTNVEIRSDSTVLSGGISGFEAALGGFALNMPASSSLAPSSSTSPGDFTTATQLLTGSFLLPAGRYELVVRGTGVSGGSASYGGNIVASSFAASAQIPEPGSRPMVVTAILLMSLLAMRRPGAGRCSGNVQDAALSAAPPLA